MSDIMLLVEHLESNGLITNDARRKLTHKLMLATRMQSETLESHNCELVEFATVSQT